MWKNTNLNNICKFVYKPIQKWKKWIQNILSSYSMIVLNTCCWWACVCFMSTSLILCSMAYFLARFTASCCSDDILGRPAPKIPGRDRNFAPGPKNVSTILIFYNIRKNIFDFKKLFNFQILSAKRSLNLEINFSYNFNENDFNFFYHDKKDFASLMWFVIYHSLKNWSNFFSF